MSFLDQAPLLLHSFCLLVFCRHQGIEIRSGAPRCADCFGGSRLLEGCVAGGRGVIGKAPQRRIELSLK